MEENYKLENVISEIQEKFDSWDSRIENNLTPVPIQDLDFWVVTLKKVLEEQKELISRSESLITRTRALDKRLLEENKVVQEWLPELGEIKRLEDCITRIRGAK